jgi:hypothetical protein
MNPTKTKAKVASIHRVEASLFGASEVAVEFLLQEALGLPREIVCAGG